MTAPKATTPTTITLGKVESISGFEHPDGQNEILFETDGGDLTLVGSPDVLTSIAWDLVSVVASLKASAAV